MGTSIKQAGIDAIPHEVAILDADGTIVAVNEAWRKFADQNHGANPTYWVGDNYFTISEEDADNLADEDIPANLRAVLDGDRDQYYHEYPCHSPEEQRWFRLDAERFRHNGDPFLLVIHTNITNQKLAELQANARSEQFELSSTCYTTTSGTH